MKKALQLLVILALVSGCFCDFAPDGLSDASATFSCFDIWNYYAYIRQFYTSNDLYQFDAVAKLKDLNGGVYRTTCDLKEKWTLVMKLNSESSVFRYESLHWTEDSVYNEQSFSSSDLTEAKLKGFNFLSFSSIRISFLTNGSNVAGYGVSNGSITISHVGNSLKSIFQTNTLTAFNTVPTRESWMAAVGPATIIKSKCYRQGFNSQGPPSTDFSIRIGIRSDAGQDCTTSSAAVGIGSNGAGNSIYHGNPIKSANFPNFLGVPNHAEFKHFAWLYVKKEFDCSGVSYCSGRGICVGANTCQCFSGFTGTDCSQFSCFSYAANSQYVCSNRRGVCGGPDLCICDSGYVGANCNLDAPRVGDGSMALPAKSCREIWSYYKAKNLPLQSGTYVLYGQNATDTYSAYCDMTTSGGGWTLVLKLDGNQNTFHYDSPLWTDFNTYNPSSASLAKEEAKFASFYQLPMSEMLMMMSIPFNTTFSITNSLIKQVSAPSLYSRMRTDVTSRFATPGTQTEWLSFAGPGSGLQPNCLVDGFNLKSPITRQKLRIGILGNDQNDCSSADSFVGFGQSIDTGFTHGNINRMGTGPDVTRTNVFGWILVRDSSVDCSHLNYCNARGRCNSNSKCTCDDGYSSIDCSRSMCFQKFSNDPSVCSGSGNCVDTDTCSCDAGYFGPNCQYMQFEGMTYQVFTAKASSADAAEQVCNQQFGGNLVSIRSSAENKAVNKIRDNVLGSAGLVFIGLKRNSTGYFWMDNTSTDTYQSWATTATKNQTCVVMGSTGSWQDVACTPLSFVCKRTQCSGRNTTDPDVCNGHGICVKTDICQCTLGYSGSQCEIPICSAGCGNGTCIAPETCNCNSGYTGNVCQTPICFDVPSSNATSCGTGNCIAPNTCTCTNSNYRGDKCQYPRCYGKYADDSMACSGKGSCVDVNHCACQSGYSGDSCNVMNYKSTSFIAVSTPKTWSNASLYCRGLYGGELVSIQDSEEREQIVRYLAEMDPDFTSVWIGLYDAESTRDFTWKDRSSHSYRAWASGQPDNAYGDENCVYMAADGSWFDDLCSRTNSFVCKQYTCYGMNHTDPSVCSGHGVCSAKDTCTCDSGFVGSKCEKDLSSKFCPSGLYSNLIPVIEMTPAGTRQFTTVQPKNIIYKQSVADSSLYYVWIPEDNYLLKGNSSSEALLNELYIRFNSSGCIAAAGKAIAVGASLHEIVLGFNCLNQSCCKGLMIQLNNCGTSCDSPTIASYGPYYVESSHFFITLSGTGEFLSIYNSTRHVGGTLADISLSSSIMVVSLIGYQENNKGRVYTLTVNNQGISMPSNDWYLEMKNLFAIAYDANAGLITGMGSFARDISSNIQFITKNSDGTTRESFTVSQSPVLGYGLFTMVIHQNGSVSSVRVAIGTPPVVGDTQFGVTSAAFFDSDSVYFAGYTSFSFYFGNQGITAAHCCSVFVIKQSIDGKIDWIKVISPTARGAHGQDVKLALDIYGTPYVTFSAKASYFVDNQVIPLPPSLPTSIVMAKLRSQDGKMTWYNTISTNNTCPNTISVLPTGNITLWSKFGNSEALLINYTNFMGNTRLNTVKFGHSCAPCNAGEYLIDSSAVYSTAACAKCPAGTYSNAIGASSCTGKCPQGTYSITLGATTSKACLACPLGTFSTTAGASSAEFCNLCEPNFYSNSIAATAKCTACPPGGSSDRGAKFCSRCTPGTFTTIRGNRFGMDLAGSKIIDFAMIEGVGCLLVQADQTSRLLNVFLSDSILRLQPETALPSGLTSIKMKTTSDSRYLLVTGFAYGATTVTNAIGSPAAKQNALVALLIDKRGNVVKTWFCYMATSLDNRELHAEYDSSSGDVFMVVDFAADVDCAGSAIPIYTVVQLRSPNSVVRSISYGALKSVVTVSSIKEDGDGGFFLAGSFQSGSLLGTYYMASKSRIFVAVVTLSATQFSVRKLVMNDKDMYSTIEAMTVDINFREVHIIGTLDDVSAFGNTTIKPIGLRDCFYLKMSFEGDITPEYPTTIGGVGSICKPHYINVDVFKNVHISGEFSGALSAGGFDVNSVGAIDIFHARYVHGNLMPVWLSSGGTKAVDNVFWQAVDDNKVWIVASFVDNDIVYPNAATSDSTLYDQLIQFTTNCTECGIGTWSSTIGATSPSSCNLCDAGTYSDATGLKKPSDCKVCPAGTWQNARGAKSCIPCTPGTYSTSTKATTSATCLPCRMGTFSTQHGATTESSCVPCPLGHIGVRSGAPSNNSCVACGAGSYSDSMTGSTQCTQCPRGTYSSMTGAISIDNCTKCDAGKYNPAPGQVSVIACIDCPEGTFSSVVGAISSATCLPCPLGTYTLPTDKGASSASICKPCEKGSYSSSMGRVGSCDLCAPGTYNSLTGQNSSAACQNCPAGSYSTKQGAQSILDCQLCPIGYYSETEGSSSEESCKRCPLGYYVDVIGANSSRLCNACPAGSWNSEPANCTACEPGYYSDTALATSNLCKACPHGTYGPNKGASSLDQCLPCPAGTYSDASGITAVGFCSPCPSGTYGPNPGAVKLSNCLICPPGTFSEEQGASSSSACQPCPAGSYSSNDGKSCTKCPPGTYSNETGLTSSAQCKPCPIGTFSEDSGPREGECQACPPGTWSNTTGLRSAQQCTPCNAGFYNPLAGQSSEDSCLACLPGSYSTTVMANSSSYCLPCPKGHYSEKSAASSSDFCKACMAGTYSDQIGASSKDQCVACTSGFYSNQTGATSIDTCSACPPGTYSNSSGGSGLQSCILCPRGSYSGTFNATSIDYCIKCPTGTTSTGSGATSSDSCVPCAAGYYANGEVFDCQPCPIGYFSSKEGSKQCDMCPKGMFASSLATKLCTECLPGTFSDALGASFCLLCGNSTFTNATKSESCTPCPDGHFCSAGSVEPIPSYKRSLSFESVDPYKQNGIQESQYSSNGLLASESVIVRIILVVVAVAFCLLVVLFIGIFYLIFKFSRKVENKATIALRKFFNAIKSLDAFTMKHFTKVGDNVQKRATFFGGILTILYVIAVITVAVLSCLEIYYTNKFDKTNLVPEQTLVSGLKSDIQGNYTLMLNLYNFIASPSNPDCTPSKFAITGFQPPEGYGALLQHAILDGSICRVTMKCVNCTLLGSSQHVEMTWNSQYAMASMIEYTLLLPHFYRNQSKEAPEYEFGSVGNGVFNITEVIYPRVPSMFFRGNLPTFIPISLTKSFYTTLAYDYFFYSIFSRKYNLIERTTSGYIASRYPVTLGSVAEVQQFSANTAGAVNLAVEFELSSNPSVYRIEEESKSTLLDLISKIIALISALGAVGALVLSTIEMMYVEIRDKIEKRKKKQKLVQSTSPAPAEASPKSATEVEMGEVANTL